jgi:ATP-binding protein involved in chromosome partitioning
MLTQEAVVNALRAVKYPGYSRDIVSFGLVKEVVVRNDQIEVALQLTTADPRIAQGIKAEAELALRDLPGAQQVTVHVRQPTAPASQAGQTTGGADPWSNQARVPGLKRVIAVASGKGGVGKSTVAVNLACAFKHLGLAVGLLDCDIYGPSVPLMMGINERPTVSPEDKLVPPANYGVKLMSMGFLLDTDQPVIWRGPMIMKTIQQFVMQVDWGTLDCLLVDLPPGTGDAQLSLCQTVPLDGGVIVTTPQEASVGVVRKGIAMFQKVNVPILGLIENMSYFTTPEGQRIEIFGHGGGANEAKRQNLPFLGEIPLYQEIRVGGDTGMPVVVSHADQPAAQAFITIADNMRGSWS